MFSQILAQVSEESSLLRDKDIARRWVTVSINTSDHGEKLTGDMAEEERRPSD